MPATLPFAFSAAELQQQCCTAQIHSKYFRLCCGGVGLTLDLDAVGLQIESYLRVCARQRPSGVAWDAVRLTVCGLNKAAGNPPLKQF